MQLQNQSLAFNLPIFSFSIFFETTSILYRSPMAYNTTATLGKLSRTDYVDFAKCQERFGRNSLSENDSNYLDIKLKVSKREDKKAEFRLRQNLLIGEADLNHFFR